jgi:hypothetical protein
MIAMMGLQQPEFKENESLGVRATRGFSKRKSRQDHNFRHEAPTNHELVDFLTKTMRRAEFGGRHVDNKKASTTPTRFFFKATIYSLITAVYFCNLFLELCKHSVNPSTFFQHKRPHIVGDGCI